jgi:hypothetical protein
MIYYECGSVASLNKMHPHRLCYSANEKQFKGG